MTTKSENKFKSKSDSLILTATDKNKKLNVGNNNNNKKQENIINNKKNIIDLKLKSTEKQPKNDKDLNELKKGKQKQQQQQQQQQHQQNKHQQQQKQQQQTQLQHQHTQRKHQQQLKMTDKPKPSAGTPNLKQKQFIPIKTDSQTNTNFNQRAESELRASSMNRLKSTSNSNINGSLSAKPTPINSSRKSKDFEGYGTNNVGTNGYGTNGYGPNSGINGNKNNNKNKNKNQPPPPVDLRELNLTLLPNSKANKTKQDTYSLTHSIAKESWQQNYKECQRHARLVKDDNLEKQCISCNIYYVICEACRAERDIPFTDNDTCIDCAPAELKVKGLIQKRDAIIRELHYKAQKTEENSERLKKELEHLRGRLDDSEKIRQQLHDDYRKSVTECMQRETENVDLIQRLANSIKEIHQYEVSTRVNQELLRDFSKILKNGEYGDCIVNITSAGERWPLHRNVLAARSEYFKKLIQAAESNKKFASNGINFDDVSSEVASQILEFIYCGKCSNINNDRLALELYDAASKYELPSLKEVIVDYFMRKLNRENCFSIASKTTHIQNKSDKFKKFISNFILTECIDLIDVNSSNAQWNKLKEENPQFVVELLEEKIKQDQNKYNTKATSTDDTQADGSINGNSLENTGSPGGSDRNKFTSSSFLNNRKTPSRQTPSRPLKKS